MRDLVGDGVSIPVPNYGFWGCSFGKIHVQNAQVVASFNIEGFETLGVGGCVIK